MLKLRFEYQGFILVNIFSGSCILKVFLILSSYFDKLINCTTFVLCFIWSIKTQVCGYLNVLMGKMFSDKLDEL